MSQFKFTSTPEGIRIQLLSDSLVPRSTESWSAERDSTLRAGIAIIFSLAEQESASILESEALIQSRVVAAMSAMDARLTGLPPVVPLRLDIRSVDEMGSVDFRLQSRWVMRNGLPLNRPFSRSGAIAEVGGHPFRIPDPVYSILEKIESFNSHPPTTEDDRFLKWGEIRSLLSDDSEEIRNDHYLVGTRIYPGRSFTLRIDPKGGDDISITPVLMSSASGAADDYSLELDSASEARAVLPEDYAEVFSKRFEQFNAARSAYPLDNGVYVVIDPVCREALDVVRSAISGTAQDRLAFCRNPRAAIKTKLFERLAAQYSDPVADEILESLFVETEAFSERVKEIGLWEKKILPWIQKAGESWLPPESVGLMFDGKRIEIQPEQLKPIRDEIDEKISSGGGSVDVNGHQIPASPELRTAIDELLEASVPADSAEKDTVDTPPSTTIGRNVLIIQTNYSAVDYQAEDRKRRGSTPGLPNLLRTKLKEHQKVGLKWLQDHWLAGSPGALLADDMGLGKTLQVLTFLSWIREEMSLGMTPRRPILVVAPVGLLRNWEAENNRHLMSPGIGDILTVYGDGLRALKRSNISELASGESSLDREALQRAGWILTSYETLRDYQISFGLIRYSIAVFDEAQKVKTPGTLMTDAAQAMNADFFITMTGTPVENRLADLWCISELTQPGLLKDLSSFSRDYEKEMSEEKLQILKSKIWHYPDRTNPPGLMIRRMKEEALDALPQKVMHPIEQMMPDVQASAYANVIAAARQSKKVKILEVLHQMRSISLHPYLQQNEQGYTESDYINSSARLVVAIKALDTISSKGEKALIFLESIDMHGSRELPLILKNRYGLSHLPLVINGTVAAPERQRRVDLFQSGKGFDVMILSPRAGGVGLTLTAANHVIHLSRWWNPAVEDQSTDRVYRIGQEKDVHVYFPLALHPELRYDSFDFKLHNLIERKRSLSRSLLVPPSATQADAEELFKATVA